MPFLPPTVLLCPGVVYLSSYIQYRFKAAFFTLSTSAEIFLATRLWINGSHISEDYSLVTFAASGNFLSSVLTQSNFHLVPHPCSLRRVFRLEHSSRSYSSSAEDKIREVDEQVSAELNKDNLASPPKKSYSSSAEDKIREVDEQVSAELNKDSLASPPKKIKSAQLGSTSTI
eukprot:XP_020398810.1 uncharacterized protein LOC103636388 [Zea mays]